MNQIIINDLSKYYGNYKALDNVSISLEQGKQYSIQGASGSGKSTLLYMMAGLEEANKRGCFFFRTGSF